MEAESFAYSSTPKTGPAFQHFLMQVLEASDGPFTKPIRRHWNTLGDKRVVRGFSTEMQNRLQPFSREHMVKMLGFTREALTKAIHDAQDRESFGVACQAFIDKEIEELFFVTNDKPHAQIARDYFDTFMDGIVACIDSNDPDHKLWSELCVDLKHYYDICLKAYEAASYRTEQISPEVLNGEESPSLAQVGLYASVATQAEADQARYLLSDKDAAHDPQKRALISEASRSLYRTIMERYYRYEYPANEEPNPLDIFFAQSILEMARNQCDESDIDDATYQEVLQERFIKIIEQLQSRQAQAADVLRGTVGAARMLDEMWSNFHHLPVEFPLHLEFMLDEAADDAQEAFPQAMREYRTRMEQRDIPISRQRSQYPSKAVCPSLEDRLIPNMHLPLNPTPEEALGHERLIEASINSALHSHAGEIASAYSIDDLAEVGDHLADVAATNVYCLHYSPLTLVFMENYFTSLHHKLVEYIEETKDPEAHKASLKHLSQVADKCHMLYEGYFTACDWMMDATDGAHDRAIMPGYLAYLNHRGKLLEQMQPQEVKEFLVPHVATEFKKALDKKGIVDEYANLLTPYFFTRCVEIASKELKAKENVRPKVVTSPKHLITKPKPKGSYATWLLKSQLPLSHDGEAGKQIPTIIRMHALQLFEEVMALNKSKDHEGTPPSAKELADMQSYFNQRLLEADRQIVIAKYTSTPDKAPATGVYH